MEPSAWSPARFRYNDTGRFEVKRRAWIVKLRLETRTRGPLIGLDFHTQAIRYAWISSINVALKKAL